MKKIIITVGLSSNLTISKDIVKQIGKLTAAIVPLAENKIIGIISTENNEAKTFSEIMRQILQSQGILKDLKRNDSFPYQGDSTKILDFIELVAKEFQYYDILVFVCKDRSIYGPNPIKAQHSFFQLGVAVEFEQLFFN